MINHVNVVSVLPEYFKTAAVEIVIIFLRTAADAFQTTRNLSPKP